MVNITIWIPDELDNQIRTALAPVHKGDLKSFWIAAGQKQVAAVLEGKRGKQTPQDAIAQLKEEIANDMKADNWRIVKTETQT